MMISSITVRCGMVHTSRIALATSSACIIVERAFASGTSGRLSRMGVSTSAVLVAALGLLAIGLARLTGRRQEADPDR